jgi:hypothetical protein
MIGPDKSPFARHALEHDNDAVTLDHRETGLVGLASQVRPVS